ncbi:MAG: TonB-dependent receptor [Rhodanobacteraceae bacterium]|jgi:iron complex outermembrane receptor protein|nr:MAG: TonB-dependent receptor [Rhodanobacteraceae bacterium]
MGQATAPLVSVDLATGKPKVLYMPTPWDFHAQTGLGPDKGQKLIQKGVAWNMDWRLNDNWDFKSITAYRKLAPSTYIDIDATPLQLGDVFVAVRQHQFSQEFQLQYSNHDNLHAVFGLYYLDEHLPSHQEAYANDFLTFLGFPVNFLRTVDDNLANKSYAGFGNATWSFGDGWSLSAGVRYTDEKKDYFRTTTAFFGPPLTAFDSTFAFTDSKSWSAVTPSLSLQKQINPQLMWYASANRGFKSGGFNGRANAPSDVSTFNPEFVWTYESGLKFRSADGRVQANGDVFYSDYKDFQARVSDITNPGSPIPNFGFPVLNAAKLTMYGAEFSGSMLVGASSALQAQIGYLNATYDKFIDPRVELDPSLAGLHAHVAFSPKWTARVAATHTFYLHDGAAITVGGDLSYRSTMWLSVDNRPGLMQPSYTLAGLFGVFDSADGHWQVRAGVRNLTDKTYKTDAQEFSSVANIQTAYFGWPRNYYVTARYNFF